MVTNTNIFKRDVYIYICIVLPVMTQQEPKYIEDMINVK